MKFLHVAVCGLLAVAGCASSATTGSSSRYFLLVPQLTPQGNAATGLPLSKWQNIGTFGSQIDCTTSMQTQQSFALGAAGEITNAQNYNQAQAVEILQAKCVAADDPQLTAK